MAARPVTANFISDDDMAKIAPSPEGFVSDADMGKLEKEEQEYSSPLETVKAGVEGLARGASLGLSDIAETKLGISTPERVRKRKEYNPIASTGGEIAGTIGSTLLAPEVSLPGLVERGAVNLAERVTANMAAQSAAKKIAGRAISDAVQGAAYGAGGLLSEQALGDHDLTAEQVMSTVGIGTLLGGAIGAGFTSAGIAAKKTLAAAKIPDMLEKAAGGAYSRIAGYLSDKDPKEINKLFTDRLKATINDDERQVVQDTIVQHVKGQDRALTDFSIATSQARPKQVSELLTQQFGKAITPEQDDAMRNVLNQFQLSIQKMRAEPEIYTAVGRVRRLETIASALEGDIEGYNKMPQTAYQRLNKLKQKMDDLAKFEGMVPDSERDTIREIRSLRGQLKETLEDSNLWGITGERQASYNQAMNRWLTAQKKFYKQFAVKTTDDAGNVVYDIDDNKLHVYLYNLGQSKNERKERILQDYIAKSNAFVDAAKQVHIDLNAPVSSAPSLSLPSDAMETVEANNLLRRMKSPYRNTGVKENMAAPLGVGLATGHPVLGAVFGALSNPASTIEKVANLQRAKVVAVKHFDHFLDAMLDSRAPEMATIVATDIAGTQKLGSKRESEDASAEVFKKRVGEINELAQNQNVLTDRIAATTNSLQGVSQVQGALSSKLGNAVGYLAQTAPQNPYANSLTKKDWQPKPTDLMKWNRRLAAVQHPYTVLQNPTPEGIDTIKNVYPLLYQEMAKRVYDRLANKPDGDVPYKAKLKLSRLFGLNLDRFGNAADIARLQASYMQQDQQQPAHSGGKQMKSASQSQTGTERIESKLT
jgi:hypothetical protein